jgi:hypothetical protein
MDKIKIVDLAIDYIKHLQELVHKYKQQEKIYESVCKANDLKQSKQDKSTNTNLINNNQCLDENLNYVRGLFNCSIEFISYFIESFVFSNILVSNNCTDASLVEFFINVLRNFHTIYFKTYKFTKKDIEYVTSRDKAKRFPFTNRKLIKKIKYSLDVNQNLNNKFYTNVVKKLKKHSKNIDCFDSSSSSSSSDEEESILAEKTTAVSSVGEQASIDDSKFHTLQSKVPNSANKSTNVDSVIPDKSSIMMPNTFLSANHLKSLNPYQIEHLINNRSQLNNYIANCINSTSLEYETALLNFQNSVSRSSYINSLSHLSQDNQITPSQIDNSNAFNTNHSHLMNTEKLETINKINLNDDAISEAAKAKKLKSNLIERFIDSKKSSIDGNSNNATNLTPNSKVSREDSEDLIEIIEDNIPNKVCVLSTLPSIKENKIDDSKMLSVFILHSSQDYYVSACLDESLIESSRIKSILNNSNLKPSALQRVKIDILVTNDCTIKQSSNKSNNNNNNNNNGNDKNRLNNKLEGFNIGNNNGYLNEKHSIQNIGCFNSNVYDRTCDAFNSEKLILFNGLDHETLIRGNSLKHKNLDSLETKSTSSNSSRGSIKRANIPNSNKHLNKEFLVENQTLENYLNQVKRSNQSSNNLTIIYKNYAKSENSEQE